MSEFSNSFHLHGATEADAVHLLRDARATGLVLPCRGRFVTMIVARRGWDAVIEKNTGTLVLYELASDHGVSVRLYEGPRERGRIARSFETSKREFDPAPWIAKGLLDRTSATAVEQKLASTKGAREPRHWLATLLALADVAGVSADELAEHREQLVVAHPKAVFIENGAPGAWESDVSQQAVILCALSAKRLAQLQAEPSLVADLLDARHEQTIKGLLDLGTRGATLVKALSRSAMADAVADAVRARSGAPLDGVPEGLTARVLQSAHVIAISAVLDAQDDAWVKQRCEAVGVALGQGLLTETYRAMRDLYRGAASRGEAMLVAVE